MNNLEKFLNDVNRKTAKEIEIEIPILYLKGIGGSFKNGVVVHEELVFGTRKILDKNEAVFLISKIISEYIKNIYSEVGLQSYLKQHPFTYKNLQIVFIVYNEKGENVFHPDLESITLKDGILSYLTVSKSEKYFYKDESYIKESYEEAAKRVGVWHNN